MVHALLPWLSQLSENVGAFVPVKGERSEFILTLDWPYQPEPCSSGQPWL